LSHGIDVKGVVSDLGSLTTPLFLYCPSWDRTMTLLMIQSAGPYGVRGRQ